MEPRRRFRFLKELSEGAFGKVYLAEMVTGDNFKSVVAIKLLHGKWAGHEEIVQRSRDEARVLGLLHHRNIIRVEDLTSISGQVAIIMEYLNGVDLKSLINNVSEKGSRVPRKVVFDIGSQAASALEAAYYHRPLQGGEPLLLIHRDIKPSNVMLTVAGEVKVLDFGTAQARFDDREAHTQALAFGSAAYMGPERLLGDPDAPSGDIFSLGITLYELLAMDSFGKVHIRPEKFDAKLDRRMEALDLSDLSDERADQVRTAMRLMLAYDANERPTATQVVELLEALADEIHDGSMRRFCREVVAPIKDGMEPEQDPNDPLTGSTLFEDSGGFAELMGAEADSGHTWIEDDEASPDGVSGAGMDVPAGDPDFGLSGGESSGPISPDVSAPRAPATTPPGTADPSDVTGGSHAAVPSPDATYLPDHETGGGGALESEPPLNIFTSPTLQHIPDAGVADPSYEGPGDATPPAGSAQGGYVVPDPGALDAETVRLSPEEAARLVAEEANAHAMPAPHVGQDSANPPAVVADSSPKTPESAPVKGPDGASATVGDSVPARRPTPVASAGVGGVKIQSAGRVAPKKSGGGIVKAFLVLFLLGGLVTAAGAGLVLTGVVDVSGFVDLPAGIGGGGGETLSEDGGGEELANPAVGSDHQSGGTVEVGEPGDGRGTARLTLDPEGGALVEIDAAVGDFSMKWDGTGTLVLVGLESGTYKTKVKPTGGGSAARATLDVEAGSACGFGFNVQEAEEWQRSECD